MNDRIVARWETRGKDWIDLYADDTLMGVKYWYRGNDTGGTLPSSITSDEDALTAMERAWDHPQGPGPCTVLRSDRSSLRIMHIGGEDSPHFCQGVVNKSK